MNENNKNNIPRFSEVFKNISICVAYDPDKKRHCEILDSYDRNTADFTMVHLSFYNIHSFTLDESKTSYLKDALTQAKEYGNKYLLYIQVGNILDWSPEFYWEIFKQLTSDDYKFLGHILEFHNGSFYIHPQFFIIDVDWALDNHVNLVDLPDDKTWTGHVIERSEDNFHGNYTPIWTRGTSELKEFTGRGAGWSIIDKLAATGAKFAPWSEKIRNSKIFTYNYVSRSESLKNRQMCLNFGTENRIFPANTEVPAKDYLKYLVKERNIKQVITTASGANTVIFPYICSAERIVIYDKNAYAVNLYSDLFKNWNGRNYKEYLENKYDVYNREIFAAPHLLEKENDNIKYFGEAFVDWWNENKTRSHFVTADILDHTKWNKLLNKVRDVPTFFNLTNILHYHPTSLFYSTEEKYELLRDFVKRVELYISPENLFLYGFDPITGGQIENNFKYENVDFSYVRSFPWRKKR